MNKLKQSIRLSAGVACAAILSVSALTAPSLAQGPASADDARMAQRTNYGRISPQAYQRALQQAGDYRQRMRPAQFGNSAASRASNLGYTKDSWEFMGPRFFVPPYTPLQGPNSSYVSGRANAVAFDNTASGVAYLAAASGGLWKTTDGGVSWLPLGDRFNYLQTSSVATDPSNGRTVYVGLGDYSGTSPNARRPGYSNANALGILKSVNGGQTFFYIAPELKGQAVSGIVVDPVNPKILTVTTGRGTVGGGVWRSTDSGATWSQVGSAPGGDWSSIQCFNPYKRSFFTAGSVPADPGAARPYFACRIGDGVYRSTDQGATWAKINAPLRFNAAGSVGELTLIAAPSSLDPTTLYLMDAGSSYIDGRLYVGKLVSGTTYNWIEITGNYGAGGNWSQSAYASLLSTAPISTSVSGVMTPTDLIYGGTLSLSGAFRTISQTIQGFPDRIWSDVTRSAGNQARTHAWQQGIAFNPFNTSNQLLANDGGVYGLTFDGTSWSFSSQLNGTLGITQINGGDFHPTNASIVLGGTQGLGLTRTQGSLGAWSGVGAAMVGIDGPFAAKAVGDYVGNTVITPDGVNQYAWVTAQGANSAWPNLRLAATANNWGSATDISPDQNTPGPNGTIYAFPFGDTDSSVQSAWSGQTKPFSPVLIPDISPTQPNGATAPRYAIFTGTNALWRYDQATASKPDTSTPPKAGVFGWWRQIGTQTFGGTISAINIVADQNAQSGQRIYVGTTTGEIWMTSNGRFIPPGSTTGDIVATWTQINAASLPALPVTGISANPSVPFDILVTLGGTGSGTGHVFRNQNTDATTRLYTDQSGLTTDTTSGNFFTRLPDVQVNGIVRDASDATNTWYIATDIGVFSTSDQGSTWADATGPLGLPNVEVVTIKNNANTGFLNVATYGRGFWRVKTGGAENRDQPNLQATYTLSRSGNAIFAVVTIKNATDPTKSVGVAQDVQIILPTNVTVGTIATNPSTTLPVKLGAIGVGASKSLTLRFPATAGIAGSLATFSVTARYSKAPTADGNPQTGTITFSSRTRLP